MKIKRLVILAGVLASFAASAQMPVLLLDGADTGGKAAVQAQAGKQLEALLQCKAGTTFTAQAVEAQFHGLGLVKSTDGFFLPLLKGVKPSLFGDEVLAALVSDADGAIEVTCEPADFGPLKAALEAAGLKPEVADVVMKPLNEIELQGEDGTKMQKLLDAVEELDDVQQVYTNAIMDEA